MDLRWYKVSFFFMSLRLSASFKNFGIESPLNLIKKSRFCYITVLMSKRKDELFSDWSECSERRSLLYFTLSHLSKSNSPVKSAKSPHPISFQLNGHVIQPI